MPIILKCKTRYMKSTTCSLDALNLRCSGLCSILEHLSFPRVIFPLKPFHCTTKAPWWLQSLYSSAAFCCQATELYKTNSKTLGPLASLHWLPIQSQNVLINFKAHLRLAPVYRYIIILYYLIYRSVSIQYRALDIFLYNTILTCVSLPVSIQYRALYYVDILLNNIQ